MTNTKILSSCLGLGLIMLFGCQGEQPSPTFSPAVVETPVSTLPTASVISPTPARLPALPAQVPQPAPPATTTASAPESSISESLISEVSLIAKDPKTQINLQSIPSAKGKLLGYEVVGDRVTVMATKTDEGYTWSDVKFSKSGAKDWVRKDFLTTQTALTSPSPPSPSVSPQPAAGNPIRKPAAADNCECPYDTDVRGRSCGKRSAYSRANGRKPVCYVGEL